MLFLTPNQQCQNTEGHWIFFWILKKRKNVKNIHTVSEATQSLRSLIHSYRKSVPASHQHQTSLLRNADVVFTFTKNYAPWKIICVINIYNSSNTLDWEINNRNELQWSPSEALRTKLLLTPFYDFSTRRFKKRKKSRFLKSEKKP